MHAGAGKQKRRAKQGTGAAADDIAVQQHQPGDAGSAEVAPQQTAAAAAPNDGGSPAAKPASRKGENDLGTAGMKQYYWVGLWSLQVAPTSH